MALMPRLDSLDPNAAKKTAEGHHFRTLVPGQFKGKVIGVFTSGGDSCGMNSAVRTVVRLGIYLGCKVFFIKEGYQGMVDGGDNIQEAKWGSVTGIIHEGGTVIGSARCKEMRELEGRLRAAKNLVKHGIVNLVCIGGDGSLTGANLLREEWPELLDELVKRGEITKEEHEACKHFNIVGMVGSIDNDFCGTDMTIGADTALHRIIEACDSIVTTARSHKRTFILEVMGRHCGYLALIAALATEAAYVFIPESPPEKDWQDQLIQKLEIKKALRKRWNIIIVAEGAIDCDGNPIKAQDVRDLIKTRMDGDAHVTVLGHTQRGGNPSAFDRILGCRMGAEAVVALLEATPDSEACVISLSGNQAVRIPMMLSVLATKRVAEVTAAKKFDEAVKLRGRSFMRNLETFKLLNESQLPAYVNVSSESKKIFNLGVAVVGSPCAGMNAAVRSFVRNVISMGHHVLAIRDGMDGLMGGNVKPLQWQDVSGWIRKGGTLLGTSRTIPSTEEMQERIAEQIKEHNISGLLVVGGFEAYHGILHLAEARRKFPELQIPMCVIPATISNNVPGSDFSLGCDTCLNKITKICDEIRFSEQGTKRRVFVVETMGGHCGYLATLAGLAGAANAAYIYEEQTSVEDIVKDAKRLRSKVEQGVERGFIIRNEKAHPVLDTGTVTKIYQSVGQGLWVTRENVLGYMQKGGSPSPFDRHFGTQMGGKAAEWFDSLIKSRQNGEGNVVCDTPDTAILLGLVGKQYKFSPVEELKKETDFERRVAKHQWWMKLRPLLKILAKNFDEKFESELDE